MDTPCTYICCQTLGKTVVEANGNVAVVPFPVAAVVAIVRPNVNGTSINTPLVVIFCVVVPIKFIALAAEVIVVPADTIKSPVKKIVLLANVPLNPVKSIVLNTAFVLPKVTVLVEPPAFT